jgi:hypothetical protein
MSSLLLSLLSILSLSLLLCNLQGEDWSGGERRRAKPAGRRQRVGEATVESLWESMSSGKQWRWPCIPVARSCSAVLHLCLCSSPSMSSSPPKSPPPPNPPNATSPCPFQRCVTVFLPTPRPHCRRRTPQLACQPIPCSSSHPPVSFPLHFAPPTNPSVHRRRGADRSVGGGCGGGGGGRGGGFYLVSESAAARVHGSSTNVLSGFSYLSSSRRSP